MLNVTTKEQAVRNDIEKELATIETIAKEIRCGKTYSPTSRELDAVARDIKSHTDRIKDLSFELGKFHEGGRV